MMPSMALHTKNKMPFGCFFWVIFILLIAGLFYVNRKTIAFVLDKTNAKSIFLKKKEAKSAQPEPSQQNPLISIQTDKETEAGTGSTAILREEAQTLSAEDVQHLQGISEGENGVELGTQGPTQTTEPTPQKEEVPVQPVNEATSDGNIQTEVRDTALYWVRVDADGKLSRQRGIRVLPKSDTPLSDALAALFAAPTMEEAKQGLRTLIPPDTKLRSAWVKDGVAFIDVSDEFQFNQYGIEGSLAQLSQVVFTATEFTTVKSVQFLIEGQKKEYLGAEGVWIGSPLSRTSF